jgi:60S ribosome subunit biogenesis protein NIP7
MTQLKRAFSKWGVFDHFLGKFRFIRINDNSAKAIYQFSEFCHIDSLPVTLPYYGGILLGFLRKEFEPSLHFAQIVSQNSRIFKYVRVSQIAERLVTYGRDIMGTSISDYRVEHENELVLILNNFGDAIGLGRTRFNPELIKNNQITVTNLLDIGTYLRDEDAGSKNRPSNSS